MFIAGEFGPMLFRKLLFLLPVIGCMFLCPPVFAAYIDNGDGTITDTCDGFMWQKSIEKEQSNTPWKYCHNLSLGGYSDWRLPTVWELSIIIDSSIQYPGSTINMTGPTETGPFNYWSSTKYPMGWKMLFYGGSGQHSAKEREAAVTVVQCVRDLN